jgi:hypothetical protein
MRSLFRDVWEWLIKVAMFVVLYISYRFYQWLETGDNQ